MRKTLWILTVYVIILKYSWSERRITKGKRTPSEKRFMVYLLKSPQSNQQLYDSWLCGGAIVSPTYVLTSGACLRDVTHLYVIAGYRKYVQTEDLDKDKCTKNRKQRVVKTCLPREYEFAYNKTSDWMSLDIGFAILENPYNFSDTTWKLDCDYPPGPIRINYHTSFQGKHIDAMVYGWGHEQGMRLPGDINNYNAEYLREGSTRMVKNKYCQDRIINNPKLLKVVTNYMICTWDGGALDGEGEYIKSPEPTRDDGCSDQFRRQDIGMKNECLDDFRRHQKNYTKIHPKLKLTLLSKSRNTNFTKLNTGSRTSRNVHGISRRQGICQNDHGSPLVIWVGPEEVLVGVASTSLYDQFHSCVNPYYYTSTACTSRFIRCALSGHLYSRRMCENIGEEEGYVLHEAEVKWNTTDSYMQRVNSAKKSVSNVVSNNQNVKENAEYTKEGIVEEATFQDQHYDMVTDDVIIV